MYYGVLVMVVCDSERGCIEDVNFGIRRLNWLMVSKSFLGMLSMKPPIEAVLKIYHSP
jgi:hypothetical protein